MSEKDKGGLGGRGKDSESLEEDVEEGSRVHHPSIILDQDSILPLETKHGVESLGVKGRGE